MTLGQFRTARQSQTNHSDHIVDGLRHKTAATKPCKVNFYNRLYRLVTDNIILFTELFLAKAAVDGRVFPWVGVGVPHIQCRLANITRLLSGCGLQ